MMNATGKTISALLLCSAVQVDARPLQRSPTAAQLRDWAAAHECVTAGRHAGIDYPHSVDRAIAGNSAGLATLFRFTDTGSFDGAAAEGHCAILFGLLQRWGDRPFSRVLGAQKRPARKAVFDAVAMFPYFKPTEFPLTYASALH
jgi:hypothetical protein